MTHKYKITGMTCSGCQAKVQSLLSNVKGVKNVSIDLSKGEASINMNQHIPTKQFQIALKNYPKYQLTENGHLDTHVRNPEVTEEKGKSWVQTYKPILLIFAYLLGTTLLVEFTSGNFQWMRWMQHFMAGFFLVFCFFKLLDLRAFVETYATYDIIGKTWKAWGYVYGFIELALGIAYLIGFIRS